MTEVLMGCFGTTSRPEGIYSATLDDEGIQNVRLLAETHRPSWVIASQDTVYVANEVVDSTDGGSVSTFRRDPQTGELSLMGSSSTLGGAPCHLSFSIVHRSLVVANYSGSVSVHSVARGGFAERARQVIRFTGSGPRPDRQSQPHPHMIAIDETSGTVWVPDLGCDTVRALRWDESGRLAEHTLLDIQTPAGSGPRHLGFVADLLAVVGELDSSITFFRKGENGFGQQAHLPTQCHRDCLNAPAAIAVVDSSTVCVSNRGCDVITTFDINATNSTFKASDRHIPSGGPGPRDLAYVSSQGALLIANKEGDSVERLDWATQSSRGRASAPHPVCFARTITGELALF